MVDLGSIKSVKTIHVIAAGNADGTGFSQLSYAYVGNDSFSPTKNTLCNS